MNNLVTIFNYNDSQVRTVELPNGNCGFIAKDICNVLEISNPTDAMKRLDDDERTLVLIEGNNNGVPVNVVTESGLYSLVLGSRKPEAKQFKRWVVHEVLPSIRKSGGYSLALPKTFSEALRLLATSIEDNEKLTAINAIQAPKAEYFDDLVSHGLSLSFRDTAKELGIPERKFIASLEDRGFVFRNNSAKLMPYAKYVPRYFELKEYSKGKSTGTQTLITVGGREMLRKAMVNVG